MDGGVNDNLGIRRLLDRLVARGSLSASFRDATPGSIHKVVLIAVNAERDPSARVDHSDRVPTMGQVVDTLLFGAGGQVTQVTLAIMSDDRARWRRELADSVGPRGVRSRPMPNCMSSPSVCMTWKTWPATHDPHRFNCLTIDREQVRHLIEAGREALRQSPSSSTAP